MFQTTYPPVPRESNLEEFNSRHSIRKVELGVVVQGFQLTRWFGGVEDNGTLHEN